MKITEGSLLQSGFTQTELQNLKNNVARFGGTLDEAVRDLSRRFRTLLWISVIFAVIFMLLVIFSTPVKILAGGVTFIIGIMIMMIAQPPVLSYKSWKALKEPRI